IVSVSHASLYNCSPRLEFFICVIRHFPRFALFPYTTLFRSRALRILVEDGLVVRKQGNGTFVAEQESRTMHAPMHCRFLDDNNRSEEHTSELQSRENLVCRLLLEKKKRGSSVTMNFSRVMSV